MQRIKQLRVVPVRKKTSQKAIMYLEYYESEIIPLAKRVHGPFMMKRWYEFPENWEREGHNLIDEFQYVEHP